GERAEQRAAQHQPPVPFGLRVQASSPRLWLDQNGCGVRRQGGAPSCFDRLSMRMSSPRSRDAATADCRRARRTWFAPTAAKTSGPLVLERPAFGRSDQIETGSGLVAVPVGLVAVVPAGMAAIPGEGMMVALLIGRVGVSLEVMVAIVIMPVADREAEVADMDADCFAGACRHCHRAGQTGNGNRAFEKIVHGHSFPQPIARDAGDVMVRVKRPGWRRQEAANLGRKVKTRGTGFATHLFAPAGVSSQPPRTLGGATTDPADAACRWCGPAWRAG